MEKAKNLSAVSPDPMGEVRLSRVLYGMRFAVIFLGWVTVSSAREAVVRLVVMPPIEGRQHATDSGRVGWEQVGPRLRSIRQDDPEALVLANGRTFDSAHPSRVGLNVGIAQAVLATKPDAWIPGGAGRMSLSVKASTLRPLGVNHPARQAGQRPGWFFKWVHGVKVVVVGVSDEQGWMVDRVSGGVSVRKAAAGDRGLAEAFPLIRKEQPDVWILVADAPDRRVRTWMKMFPEFDVGVALGSDSPIEESRVKKGLLVAPGNTDRWMAETRVVFDTVQRRVIRSGGQLVDLRRMPVSVRKPDGARTAAADWAAQVRDRFGADMSFVSLKEVHPGSERFWLARLTRTELRAVLGRWIAVDGFSGVGAAGLDREAWGKQDLRLPAGGALHATKRYTVVLEESLLVSLGDTGRLPALGLLREPRVRWAGGNGLPNDPVHR